MGSIACGANEAALNTKNNRDVKNIKKYIDKAKDKNDPFRLVGCQEFIRTMIQGLKLCKQLSRSS